MDRRRLVTALIALAAVLVVAIEGYTFLGLVVSHLGGGTPTPTSAPPGDGTATPAPTGVDIGDELLPETDRTETLSTATVTTGGDGWTLVLTVIVENTASAPYELRLGNVTADEGVVVAGSATTGRIPPGETATVTAQWHLPGGTVPQRVAVTAIAYRNGEAVVVADRTVRLAGIPVRG